MGSSLLRPIGNRFLSGLIFHWTSLFVVQIMIVHRRSRAESTKLAISDNEEEKKAAIILAANRHTLAKTLI